MPHMCPECFDECDCDLGEETEVECQHDCDDGDFSDDEAQYNYED